MELLPDALAPLAAYNQWITWTVIDGKKIPTDHRTGYKTDAHNPQAWTDPFTAMAAAKRFGHGVGFVFTTADPFWFIDIDHCLQPSGNWSPLAMTLIGMLPGVAIEVSTSGNGLHLFGTGTVPEHACKNTPLGIELYTEGRFVALTGDRAMGWAATDCSAIMPSLVAQYFPPNAATSGEAVWTTTAVPEWNGPIDDAELIDKARKSRSAADKLNATMGKFEALWTANSDALADLYPPMNDRDPYDRSQADAALAQSLAFWTGKNADRMWRIMWQSGLVRDKWHPENHKKYLTNTILNAISMQRDVLSTPAPVDHSIAQQFNAPTLKGSPKQIEWGGTIRSAKLVECKGDEQLIAALSSNNHLTVNGSFWIDHQHDTPDTIAKAIAPVETAAPVMGSATTGPTIVEGFMYLGVTQQIEHFKGCVYIQDQHRIFTPTGALLKQEQFNATYGGYVFQLESNTSGKTTRKAFEAFTESQAIRYPKAETICFRPEQPSGAIIEEEDRTMLNVYVPINTRRIKGDPAPFLQHLAKVLPDQRDQAILLAYMAACIQYKGIKFQWAPLLQGAEGNGKTLFTRVVAFAIGKRYTHLPKADDIDNKFNSWVSCKLFIGVEDIYVPEHRREVIQALLPLITNDQIEIQAKGKDQYTGDNRANFILNTNPKEAIRKTRNDRRFAVFFTAQQSKDDIERDGMGGDYFPRLYNWLKGEGQYKGHGYGYGYAIVADYLESYPIPDELNPATTCHRAPITSTTEEAIGASMGGVEQEILEAIDEQRPGFAGGWISSMALDRLLQDMRKNTAIPPNKRRELLQGLGYDWHPALNRGRVNNYVRTDQGKPRLFIKQGHVSANLTTAAEAVKAYEMAQSLVITAQTRAQFGG